MKTKSEPGAAHALRRGPLASVRWLTVKVLLPLLLSIAGSSAFAAGSCELFDAADTVDAGSMTMPINLAPGVGLKTVANSSRLACMNNSSIAPTNTTNYTSFVDLTVNAAPVSGSSDVYPTNIAGVGVSYTVSSSGCSPSTAKLTGTGVTTFACPFTLTPNYQVVPFTITANFVRTGTAGAASGALTTIPRVLVSFRSSDLAGSWTKADMLSGVATGSANTRSCSVVQNNLAVDLGLATVQQFQSGVGTTANSKAFNLTLNCQSSLNIKMTLTDATDAANRTDVLKLSSGSSAQGLGIQVLDRTTPFKFGPDSAAAGNTNQVALGVSSSTGNVITVPLTARYIRTGTVVPGSVKAIATFTMSYQ